MTAVSLQAFSCPSGTGLSILCLQMSKNKLPDEGSEYEGVWPILQSRNECYSSPASSSGCDFAGAGGTTRDAIDFIIMVM